MGARSLNRVQFSLERDVVRIFGSGIGAGAANLTSIKGAGVASVAQTATGKYTITLRDKWPGLLMFKGTVVDANATTDDWEVVVVEELVATSKTVKIAVFKGGTLTDLTSDRKLLFEIVIQNTSQLPRGY